MINNHITFFCEIRMVMRDNQLTAEEKLKRIKQYDWDCSERDLEVLCGPRPKARQGNQNPHCQ